MRHLVEDPGWSINAVCDRERFGEAFEGTIRELEEFGKTKVKPS